MNRYVITAMLISFNCIAAWDDSKSDAIKNGANVKFVLHVSDEQGVAISNARVAYGFSNGYDKFNSVYGLTDSSGDLLIEGKCRFYVGYSVGKDGYYFSDGKIDYANSEVVPAVIDGEWQPYGNRYDVTLKRRTQPADMSMITRMSIYKIPEYGKWLGFDFERKDFCSPFGRGISDDILLRFAREAKDALNYKISMEVSFTNNPYAGFYELEKDEASELKSVHFADTKSAYARKAESYCYETTANRIISNTKLPQSRYLVFRTRTKVDESGNLVSAHYGKIYAPWDFDEGMCFGRAFFNTTPNEPNLEDKETFDASELRIRRMERNMKSRESKAE